MTASNDYYLDENILDYIKTAIQRRKENAAIKRRKVEHELGKPHPNTRRIPVRAYSEEFCDILLSYLLDEGYVDNVKSAEMIVENMSEGWIEYILDEQNVRGAGRRVGDRITGNDIRSVTRGGGDVYKKPKWKDKVEVRVDRQDGTAADMRRSDAQNRNSNGEHENADDNARRNRIPSGQPRTIPTGRRLRDRARNR
jgi:hypothetical protein